MGLFPADSRAHEQFNVLASPVGQDTHSAVIDRFEDRAAVGKFLTALCSGRELIFMLTDQAETIVKLPVPNDDEFQKQYEEICGKIAKAEIAFNLVRSQRPPTAKQGFLKRLFGG